MNYPLLSNDSHGPQSAAAKFFFARIKNQTYDLTISPEKIVRRSYRAAYSGLDIRIPIVAANQCRQLSQKFKVAGYALLSRHAIVDALQIKLHDLIGGMSDCFPRYSDIDACVLADTPRNVCMAVQECAQNKIQREVDFPTIRSCAMTEAVVVCRTMTSPRFVG